MKRLVISIGVACAALVAVAAVAVNSGAQGGAPPAGTLDLVSRDRESATRSSSWR